MNYVLFDDFMRKKLAILIFCILRFLTIDLYAQVGINNIAPNILSELDIKNVIHNNDTIPKGILIPRLTEQLRNAIDVKEINDPNGLLIYNIDEDCYNYYSIEDKEWKSLCGALGKARFDPVNCSDITIEGSYVSGLTVDASNYLQITLNVKKIGSYNISITTGNGYYFSATGTALDTGFLTITAQAQGKPNNVGTDNLTIKGINLASANCLPHVIVLPPVSNYAINCHSIEVTGNYLKDRSLTSDNVIKMTVTVTTPGSYSISTTNSHGIQFRTSGIWDTAGTKNVVLVGSGAPDTHNEFTIDINANTRNGQAHCEALIPVYLPAMTYGIIASTTSGYTWGSAERRSALSSTTNFGPNGTFRVASFTLHPSWSATTSISEATTLMTRGQYPDVILYNAYGVGNPTDAFMTQLIDYVNNGGVLIYGTADNGPEPANILLNGIFGPDYTNQAANLSTVGRDLGKAPYPIANLVSDPIINGPFGNAAGQYWEEDNQGSIIVRSLPENSIQVASVTNQYTQTTVNTTYSIVWYNERKNFVYFGDSTASAYAFSPANDGWPSLYVQAQDWIPAPRYAGLTGRQVMCYNSILEFNAIAWALRKAVTNGINPH